MRAALHRLPLERVVQLVVAALILLTLLSQGSILSWIGAARKLRWLALFGLVALALVYAWRARNAARLRWEHLAGAFLVALAVASATWSAFPRLSVERAGAFGLVLIACGALGYGSQGRVQSVRRLLEAVVVGAAAVAVGGLLVLLFRHDRAVEPATSVLPARFQGLGGGPNTAAMVLAVALPLAVYSASEARRTPSRLVAIAATLLVTGSIAASGSRGALVGGFGGLLAYVALASAGRRRIVALAAVVMALVVAALLTRIPQPNPTAPPLPSAGSSTPTVIHPHPTRPLVKIPPPRLQDDVGRPPYGVGETTKQPRTLFGSSGRSQAWQGAIDLGAERALGGYGFGTEDHVFFDRYANFNSSVPENSYIGLFLQVGAFGLAVFAAFFVALLGRGAVSARRLDEPGRRAAAACAGGLVAGLLLGFFQSYVYAAGNNATVAVWISAFLLAALSGGFVPLASRRVRVAGAIGVIALIVLVPVGNAERAHRGHVESRDMNRTLREIGSLDQARLDAFRYLSAEFQCLLYRRGRDPFALELCVDRSGRVVETIDRRTAPKPRVHSLRDDPTRSTLRVDRAQVTRLLHELGVPLRYLPQGSG